MILRLASGSVTPASLPRNCSLASTWITLACSWPANISITSSPSFSRSRPWSTNTQVSWSPMARWISAAATLESTPPDRPRITSSSPTCSRMRSTASAMWSRMTQSASRPADAEHEALEDRAALQRVRDLGVELHAVVAARLVGHAGDRAARRAGHQLEAGRQRGDLVAVAHPDLQHAVAFGRAEVLDAVEQPRVAARAHLGVAELAVRPPRPCRPAAPPWCACRSRCPAPARRAPTPPAARAGPAPRRCWRGCPTG